MEDVRMKKPIFHIRHHEIPEFSEIIKTFEILYPKCIFTIAGGAVRDILLHREPKDIDIFICGVDDWTQEGRLSFKKKLNLSKLYYKIATSNLPWHKYEKFLLLSIIWKMSAQFKEKELEVQFCGFPKKSINALLETFDWEICHFAYIPGLLYYTDRSQRLIDKIKSYSPTNEKYRPPAMRLTNFQFPISNLRRGFKFENRYPIKLDYRSITRLCREVLKEDERQKLEKRAAKKK